MKKTPVLCLAGPTASGKSAVTLALADALARQNMTLEVIAVDSATLYRGMDIGTAKPAPDERARLAHHLIDIRDPAQGYSVAEFVYEAQRCIADIFARGRLPLLCGGTMMYFKALRDGLADLPQADPATRAAIAAQAREQGWPALHAELMRVDPATACRLAPGDSQRLQRALEVWQVSGIPLSQWLVRQQRERERGQESQAAGGSFEYFTISLEPSSRSVLHERIARRFAAMMRQGLLDEVRRLHARADLHAGLPSMRCVGYRQLWAYLDGQEELDAAVTHALAATRQLAKRQMTWLRGLSHRQVVDSLADDVEKQVIEHVRRMGAL